MDTAEDITRTIVQVCSGQPEIVAAYLFGSMAAAGIRAGSDVDVAILLDQAGAKDFPLLSFISRLDRALNRRVDVTVLNRSGELLKYEIRRTGKLVFEKSPELRKRFEVMGRKTFEDFLYLHNRYVNTEVYRTNRG